MINIDRYYGENKKRFFEIADISSERDDVYFRFGLSENSISIDDNLSNFISLSSYYYDALILSFDKLQEKNPTLKDNGKVFIKYIERFKTEIQSLWIYFSNNREDINVMFFQEIANDIKFISKEIKFCIKGQNNNVIKKTENLELFFDNIYGEKYKKWKTENEELLSAFSEINCVAMAYPCLGKIRNETNSYFSLNGASTDYCGNSQSLKNIGWNYKIKRSFRAVGSLLYYIFGYRFIECHLTDYTMRYTKFDFNIKNNPRNWNGEMEFFPVCLNNDLCYISHKNFERHYSCCERKIIANMDFINRDYFKLLCNITVINKLTGYIFKILKEPCEMCRGALIGCYNIRYGLNDSDYRISLNKGLNKNEPLVVTGV